MVSHIIQAKNKMSKQLKKIKKIEKNSEIAENLQKVNVKIVSGDSTALGAGCAGHGDKEDEDGGQEGKKS